MCFFVELNGAANIIFDHLLSMDQEGNLDVFDCLDFYSNQQRSEDYYDPNSPDFGLEEQSNQQKYEEIQHYKQQVEKIVNTMDSQSGSEDQQENAQFNDRSLQLPLEQQENRRIRQIQCSLESKLRYSQRSKGQKRETENMGKNTRTIVINFMTVLTDARCLDVQQLLALKRFEKTHGAVKDYQLLFKSEKLQKWCHNFFSSKNIVARILSSAKMDMKNKLIMVKYMETLRRLSGGQLDRWKYQ